MKSEEFEGVVQRHDLTRKQLVRLSVTVFSVMHGARLFHTSASDGAKNAQAQGLQT